MCCVCLAEVNGTDYSNILQKEAGILRNNSECGILDACVIPSVTQNR